MLISLFLISGLTALSSASPLGYFARGCTEGLFNCLDGKTYQQCVAGGTWSVTMQVAPGTTCQVGISANPWAVAGPDPVASAATSEPPTPTTASAPSLVTTISLTTTLGSQPSTTPASIVSVPPTTSSSQAPQASSTGSSSCVNIKNIDDWLTWEEMKQKYQSILGTSCQSSWQVANNSPDETQAVFDAIEANHGTVDPRFVLSIAVQESSGCVRVPTTNNGVRNPGLMQDSNGSHSCNDGSAVQNPCPTTEINGMIQDGITGGDDNYEKALASAASAGYSGAMQYAVAARIYNSGSFNANDLCDGITSTASYVTDVINRLQSSAL